MLVLSPLIADDIRMTVEMPMEMPSTVRPERNLFLRRVSSAMRTDSLESLSLMAKAPCLQFRSKSGDGIEFRGLIGWVNAKEQANSSGDKQADQDGPDFDFRREGNNQSHDFGQADA